MQHRRGPLSWEAGPVPHWEKDGKMRSGSDQENRTGGTCWTCSRDWRKVQMFGVGVGLGLGWGWGLGVEAENRDVLIHPVTIRQVSLRMGSGFCAWAGCGSVAALWADGTSSSPVVICGLEDPVDQTSNGFASAVWSQRFWSAAVGQTADEWMKTTSVISSFSRLSGMFWKSSG